ncbi:MAG: hypothetical protein ACFFCS_22425 [Candidatus Hodarchaeota archaeon]
MLRKRKIAIAGVIFVLSALFFSIAPVSGDSLAAFADGTGDVYQVDYSGNLANPTSCGDATTGYSHMDVTSVAWQHTTGIGYEINITTSAAFDVTSHTYLCIMFDTTGSSSTPPSSALPQWGTDFTLQVELGANGTNWNLMETNFDASTSITGNAAFTLPNQVTFTIAPGYESNVNGTAGFDGNLDNWLVFGFVIDDDTTSERALLDVVNWDAFYDAIVQFCGGDTEILGYPLLIISFASIAGVFLLVRKLRSRE